MKKIILEKNISQGIFFLIIFLILNFPKTNLIGIQGVSQGIRIDDVLILLLVVFNLHNISLDKTKLTILLYVTFTYLFSFVHQADSIHFRYIHLHYFKFLEYFFLYLVLLKKINQKFIFKIAISSLFFQFLLILSSATGLASRATGTTAGPWELTMMLGVLYFIVSNYLKNLGLNFFSFINLLILFLIIIFAKSRIVLISMICVIVLKKWKWLLLFSPFLILVYLIYNNIIEFESGFQVGYFQLQTSLNFLRDYGDMIVKNWMVGDFYLGEGGRYFDRSTQLYDPSLVGRLQQWGRYLEIMVYSDLKIMALLFGSGPGSGGIINDGMYIKFLVDFGMIGLIGYLVFMTKIFIKKKETRPLIIFISICCITLDFYWPTKIAYSCILALCYFGEKKYEAKTINK
jgi:hypothetical protein